MTKILIAGIGNELFGDDGFGVAVVQELRLRRAREEPVWRHSDLTLLSPGTRGFDLVAALIDGYDAAILIDAAPRGRAPGTLYVLAPSPACTKSNGPDTILDLHGLEPGRALELAKALGAPLSRIFVVGCEPTEGLEMSSELSPAVAAAIEPAIDEVARLIGELRTSEVGHA